MLAQWWGESIIYGSKEWELMKNLSPLETEPVLDKNRYSAFYETNLDESLRSRGIEELIMTGVMTNCCCETTAKDGFVRDYRIFFVSDATATVNEELHLASLMNLAYGFAHVLSTDQLCRSLRQP
jgi:isochorismate hydrolase